MNPHFPNCDEDECIVCESYYEELREWLLPLYLRISKVYDVPNDDQTTVADYQ